MLNFAIFLRIWYLLNRIIIIGNCNVVPSAMQEFVEHNLYQNELLIGEAAKLRDRFMNVSQALIHGDLHTGSIL